MGTEVKLPALGENIDEAEILRVLVAEGDAIAKDQAILEVESDKATLEVPSPAGGKVSKVLVKEGDRVGVGQVVLQVEGEAAGEAAGEVRPPTIEKASAPAPPQVKAEEKKRAGAEDEAAEDARAEGRSEAAARATVRAERGRRQEEPRPTGSSNGHGTGNGQWAPAGPPESFSEGGEAGPVFASPSVRQFAREIGVDVRAVPGSGPGGRISVDDVKAHARGRLPGGRPAVEEGGAGGERDAFGAVERQRLGGTRRAIAERMAKSWAEIPHVTLQAEADVTLLEEARRRYTKPGGPKITLTAVLAKVVAACLERMPRLNASLDLERGEAIYKSYVHLGVAVDTERGLLVPVLRDVPKKSLSEVAAELAALAEGARAGKLGKAELQGASFSLTNLGGLGIGYFTPIINPPEVAILGVGRAKPATGRGGEARWMLPLSLSIDHRVVDGADGARFLKLSCDGMADPLVLILGE